MTTATTAATTATTGRAPSIADIARRLEAAGSHYFDRDTLRFFGQTRRDFRARYLKDGRLVVYARTHRGWDCGFEGAVSSLAVVDMVAGDTHGIFDKSDQADVIAEINGGRC